MPASPEALALAETYRRRLVQLRTIFIREYAALWQATLDPTRWAATSRVWLAQVDALIRRWRPIFDRLAADYYARAAQLDAGQPPVIGGFVLTAGSAAALARLPIAPGRVVSSLLRTAGGTLFSARNRGVPFQQAIQQALVVSAQDAARLAQDAGRERIADLVRRDPIAVGWMRVTDSDPCAFCAMLASRGPVYKSQESAGFELDPVRGEINRYHPSCACQVIPVFTREPVLPETTQRWQREWTAAQRSARESGDGAHGTTNDALNNFRRHLTAVQG